MTERKLAVVAVEAGRIVVVVEAGIVVVVVVEIGAVASVAGVADYL